MILVGKVEDGIAQHNHQLFLFVYEDSGQRSIPSFDDDVLSRPLPELRLSGPERFCVMADDQGRVFPLLFPLFLFLSFAHKLSLG